MIGAVELLFTSTFSLDIQVKIQVKRVFCLDLLFEPYCGINFKKLLANSKLYDIVNYMI
ncbi:MAG: hypothetical protein R3Y29_07120 [bacterium]